MKATFSEVDNLLNKARLQLDYQRFLTPKNFNEENKKFLNAYEAHIVYNPQYKYNSFNSYASDELLNAIKSYRIPTTDSLGKLFEESIVELEKQISMYKLLGDDNSFTEAANKVYGLPAPIYKQQALDSFVCDDSNTKETLSVDALKRILEKRLNEYGLNWEIIISPQMATRVSVETDFKKIFLNKNKSFSINDVIRLVVHEIDTHVLRAENGFLRGYYIFSGESPHSLIHEEGLALYNEHIHNVQDIFAIKLYGARYLCCIDIHKSFYELFSMLLSFGCSKSLAMYVVSRIKRGLSDTSKPGGFIKDYVYYQGFQEVSDAIKKNKRLYQQLYYGAVSLFDVALLIDDIENAITNNSIILPMPLDINNLLN